jgi:hypothetical protein
MEVRRLAAGSATETLSRKIPLSCDLDAAKFRERTSAMGHSRRSLAASKPGYVRYARMATKIRIAAK